MTPATSRTRHSDATRLLTMDFAGNIRHRQSSALSSLLRPGDVIVANDAATLPASLSGFHLRTGARIEVRLAGRDTLALTGVSRFVAIVFGEGDYRTATENRALPPELSVGDQLQLGPLHAVVVKLLDHPRFIAIRFEGSPREIWEGLARHGRPIQYSHISVPLAVWDTWTRIAGPPVAFEPPSAGFVLDWQLLGSLPAREVRFGTITHAAGISSTGDPELDARLPLDEPYRIPESTAHITRAAKRGGHRVIAVGTTVVRALEHAARVDVVVNAGEGIATQRIGPGTPLHVVDAIISGTHERGTSHYELLRAFAGDQILQCMDAELGQNGYRTHEFGDFIFLERQEDLIRQNARDLRVVVQHRTDDLLATPSFATGSRSATHVV